MLKTLSGARFGNTSNEAFYTYAVFKSNKWHSPKGNSIL